MPRTRIAAERTLLLNNQPVNYFIRTSARARQMRLVLYQGSELVLTLPRGVSRKTGEEFVREHADWILKKYGALAPLSREERQARLKDYYRHRAAAAAWVRARIAELNGCFGFPVRQIMIRNQKTRWGSCSRRGNLNFNYEIMFLPQQLANYLIVHELCHLREFNHSPAFWRLVAAHIAEYRTTRRDLKQWRIGMRRSAA